MSRTQYYIVTGYSVPAWKEKMLILNGANADVIKTITSDEELGEYMKSIGYSFKPITPPVQSEQKKDDLPPAPLDSKAEITNGAAQPVDYFDLHLRSEYQNHINPESRILRHADGKGGSTIIG